jgi:hypothetical protein
MTYFGAKPANSLHFERPLIPVWNFSDARAMCFRRPIPEHSDHAYAKLCAGLWEL